MEPLRGGAANLKWRVCARGLGGLSVVGDLVVSPIGVSGFHGPASEPGLTGHEPPSLWGREFPLDASEADLVA